MDISTISNKKLKKAFTFYQTGQLKEALDLCEKVLQKENCDEEALELEGKILKDLGRLEEAIITWKINAEYNDNEDAKNSLASVDEEKKQHTLSYENLSQLISEAANNSSTNIEIPISTKDEAKTLEPHTEKVENIKDSSQKQNDIKENQSETISENNNKIIKDAKISNSSNSVEEFIPEKIEEFTPKKVPTTSNLSNSENKKSSKKLIYTSAGAIIVAIALVVGVYSVNINSKKASTAQPNTEVTQQKVDTSKPSTTTENTNTTESTKILSDTDAESLINQLTTDVQANAIDSVNTLIQKYPVDVIPEKYISDYNNAVEFMKIQGVNYYYEEELSAYNNKNYQDALTYFNSAVPYYNDFTSAPTMLFLAASSYNALGEKEQAMESYKQYLNQFPDSQYYTEECLYNLAIYYSQNNDLTQAKQYASELSEKYPNSMYNNNNIQDILKK